MEVRPCEWPCDDFLRAAGIYEDFYELAENAGLTAFLHDQREQYLFIIFWKISEIFSNFKQKWTKLNKTDSNYSYKCLEPISSIRTTWNHINLACKLKNMVTYAAQICKE